MHKELLAQSPLLILPLAALVIFVAVFFAVVVRTMAKKAKEYDGVAGLPLAEEDRHGA